MVDITLSPSVPVTGGAIVSSTNPLPVTIVGGTSDQGVVAATTTAGNTSGMTYANGTAGVGATLTGTANTAITFDGITLTAVGQRVLVKNDTQSPSGAYNGVYTLTRVQTVSLAPILTRAVDYNTVASINTTGPIPVLTGTVNALSSWILTTTVVTIGTTALSYSQFSGNPANYLPLAGGTLTGALVLAAGTTSLAPLKFQSGPLLTSPVAGVIEFLTDAFYGTITTGSGRKTFAFLESPTFTTPNIGVATGTSLIATGVVTAGAASTLGWTGRSLMASAADGQIALTANAGSGFTTLGFGGNTANDPGFTRASNGVINATTGNNSAFVTLKATLQVSTSATTGLVAGVLAAQTNASIVITDGGGQVYRIPCII